MVKVLDCNLEVSQFELHSRYSLSDLYSWERYEPPYPPVMGQVVSLLFFCKGGFGIR